MKAIEKSQSTPIPQEISDMKFSKKYTMSELVISEYIQHCMKNYRSLWGIESKIIKLP